MKAVLLDYDLHCFDYKHFDDLLVKLQKSTEVDFCVYELKKKNVLTKPGVLCPCFQLEKLMVPWVWWVLEEIFYENWINPTVVRKTTFGIKTSFGLKQNLFQILVSTLGWIRWGKWLNLTTLYCLLPPLPHLSL